MVREFEIQCTFGYGDSQWVQRGPKKPWRQLCCLPVGALAIGDQVLVNFRVFFTTKLERIQYSGGPLRR